VKGFLLARSTTPVSVIICIVYFSVCVKVVKIQTNDE
jgi:hypothetical protein